MLIIIALIAELHIGVHQARVSSSPWQREGSSDSLANRCSRGQDHSSTRQVTIRSASIAIAIGVNYWYRATVVPIICIPDREFVFCEIVMELR